MKYTVVLTKDEDGGFDAAVPALPGCRSWGRTRKDALRHAQEAIEAYIESLQKDGDPIPLEIESRTLKVG